MQAMTSSIQEPENRGRDTVGHMGAQHTMAAIVQTQNLDTSPTQLLKIVKEEATKIVVTIEGREKQDTICF